MLQALIAEYENTMNTAPVSPDDLLDFAQKKYIAEEIDIKTYQSVFGELDEQGAVSAHDYSLS